MMNDCNSIYQASRIAQGCPENGYFIHKVNFIQKIYYWLIYIVTIVIRSPQFDFTHVFRFSCTYFLQIFLLRSFFLICFLQFYTLYALTCILKLFLGL